MKAKHILVILILLLNSHGVDAQVIRKGKIVRMIRNSPVLKGHFTGFSLYDLDKRKLIAGQASDKYFTPASNTKLFTFYAGLKLLKDSIGGLQFIEKGDSLIFWGTADPSFLNPDFSDQKIRAKLNGSNKKLFWANGLHTGNFYGVGWTYDDYNEYYQPEMSELPVYGNVVHFKERGSQLISLPVFRTDGLLRIIPDIINKTSKFRIRRNVLDNDFHQPPGLLPAGFTQTVPFKVGSELVSELLKEQLPSFSGRISYPKPSGLKTWNSIPSDTLFKHMLLPSDNFLAEQTLLNIAAENGLEMNTSVVIEYVINELLSDLPDKPVWVDGSGLSRQNLFTPRTMVKICEMIYDEVGNEKLLFDLLPQGGKTGTLKNLYKGEEVFVIAKTGSLSNNHNLSGYLITRAGKRLIFSFMNNNYVRPTADIRSEMERIITYIHQNY